MGLMGLMRLIGPIGKGPELTALDTVATHYATRVVHLMVLEVDASCLTVLGAQRAVLTFILVEMNLQDREA